MSIKFPTFNNTIIVVVSYNPNVEEFIKNIDRFINIAAKVVIVDNNSSIDITSLILHYNNVYLIKSENNKGIAWGLNQGINKALCLGAEFILTFDQDSFPINNILAVYAKQIINFKLKSPILMGTTYCEKALEIYESKFTQTLTLITSGTLHSRDLFYKVGFYDEELFIDSVDFDYSIRVHNMGIPTIKSQLPMISHHLGAPIIKNGLKSTNHSKLRRYYMARNNIIISRRYIFSNPLWIVKKNVFFLVDIIKLLIVESHKYSKIKSIYRGLIDGFKF